MERVQTAAVIGGGISGLAAAWELQRMGVDVHLYEKSDRVGGVIRSHWEEGFLHEEGPNEMLIKQPEVEKLIKEDLGLAEAWREPDARAKKRFVLKNGKPVAVPLSPPAFLTTPLFSTGAKLRLLLEPLRKRGAEDSLESVADFFRRRMGQEFVDYAIAPLLTGIYAGDVEQLSMRHVFPRFYALEQQHGSLLRAALKGAAKRYKPKMVTFAEGMQTLTDAFASPLQGVLRLDTTITDIRERWTLEGTTLGKPFSQNYDAVICATPAFALGALPWPSDIASCLQPVAAMPYAPVSTLFLGFRRAEVKHPLDGFGLLAPPKEQRNILGVIFYSSLFPNRAPEGMCSLIVFLGGMHRPDIAHLPAEAAVSVVLEELAEVLGVKGEPVFQKHTHWARAIPQYTLEHAKRMAALHSVELANPGLKFVGNYREGVGAGDCIAHAVGTAERLARS